MPTIEVLRTVAQRLPQGGKALIGNEAVVFDNATNSAYVLSSEKLGPSTDGAVYQAVKIDLASGNTMGKYAAKCITNPTTTRRNPKKIENEVSAAGDYLGRKNVFYHKHDDNEHYVFTPLAQGEQLDKYIENSSARQQSPQNAALAFLEQGKKITGELANFHNKGLIHFDLKIDNIFYDSANRKVTFIDLGNASRNVPGDDIRVEPKGANTNYNLGEITAKNASKKSDVYAMANILKQMGIERAMDNLGPEYAQPKQDMKTLLEDMQNPEQSKRPSAEESSERLRKIQAQVHTINQQRTPAGPGYQQPLPVHRSPIRREAAYPPPPQPRPAEALTKGVTLTAQSPISYNNETLVNISRDLSNDKVSVGFDKSADGKTITLSIIHKNDPTKINKYDIQVDGSTLSTSKAGANNLYVLSAMSRLTNNKIAGANIHNGSTTMETLNTALRINRENPGKLDVSSIVNAPPSPPPRPFRRGG